MLPTEPVGSIPEETVHVALVSTTLAYWGPSWSYKTENPEIIIEAGKTLYVLGQDETEQFYKVLLVCQFLWVPKDTVGPNYDEVWNGTLLPMGVVE